jgi:hypothetical protein
MNPRGPNHCAALDAGGAFCLQFGSQRPAVR